MGYKCEGVLRKLVREDQPRCDGILRMKNSWFMLRIVNQVEGEEVVVHSPGSKSRNEAAQYDLEIDGDGHPILPSKEVIESLTRDEGIRLIRTMMNKEYCESA